MTHRFHVDAIGSGDEVRLSAATVHHLRVLGLGEGSEVVLFDGTGVEATARIETLSHADARARILQRAATTRETPLAVTLATAVPKGRRMDTLVRMCAELGVREIVPLVTRRSVVKPPRVRPGQPDVEAPTNKLKRWRKICVAAAEQSGRTHVTTVAIPDELPGLLDRTSEFDLTVILSTDAAAEPLVEVLRANVPARSLLVLVGPEGGWTSQELAAASGRGARPAKLTASVLRVETACVAAAAVAVVLGSH